VARRTAVATVVLRIAQDCTRITRPPRVGSADEPPESRFTGRIHWTQQSETEVPKMVRERPIVLTPEGKAALEQELEHLRQHKLPLLLERLQQLSNEGDISDNSEYEDTKEELVLTEARIREIEHILRRAQMITRAGPQDEVRLGSRVTVIDEEGSVETWVIVSPEEANAAQGRISIESPVGAALLGKRVGTTVTVRAPGGEMRFTIQRIE
jgi:transcription elongation factor GreA